MIFIRKSYQFIIEKYWIMAFIIIAKKRRKNPANIKLIIFIYGLNIKSKILTIDAIKSGTTINHGTVAENSQL